MHQCQVLKHEKTLASSPRHYSVVFSCEKTEYGHLFTNGVHQIGPLSFRNFANNSSQIGLYFNICDKINTIIFNFDLRIRFILDVWLNRRA